MATSNSDFFIKYGLNVGNTATFGGNASVGGSLTVAGALTVSNSAFTHNIQGNVVFSSNTVVIDRVGNRVGVGGPAEQTTLKVHGTANVTIDSRVGRDLSVGGNVAITNAISVAGAANLTTLQTTGHTNVASLYSVGDITLAPGATVDGVDISELVVAVSNVPVLRVYDVNGVQIFP